MTALILFLSFVKTFYFPSDFCNFSTIFSLNSINYLMSLFSCLFSCPVWVRRSCKCSNLLTSIFTISTFIFSPSAVTRSLNSPLYDLLFFMSVFWAVLGDFLFVDLTNILSCYSLVCFINLCWAYNVVLHFVQLSTVLVF